jgi:hypothetical protein
MVLTNHIVSSIETSPDISAWCAVEVNKGTFVLEYMLYG